MNTTENNTNDLRQKLTEIFFQENETNEEGCGCGSGCGCHDETVKEMEPCDCDCNEDNGSCCKN